MDSFQTFEEQQQQIGIGIGIGMGLRSRSLMSIGSLKLWLRGEDLSGGDATAVALWPDASPHNHNATQATAINQPTKRANALNDRTIVEFDGNDFLSYPTLSGLNESSVFVVANRTGSPSTYCTLLTVTGQFGIYSQLANGEWGCYETASRPSGVILGADFKVLSVVRTGVATLMRTNGGNLSTQAKDSEGSYASLIGYDTSGAQYHQGKIAELLIFSEALSEANRLSVESYLQHKFALAPGEAPVRAGLILELIADNVSGADGDAVSLWHDTSPNANDVSQAVALSQPTKKTNVYGSHAVVRFDGTRLMLATSFTGQPVGNGAHSIFIVVAYASQNLDGNVSLAFGVDSGTPTAAGVYLGGGRATRNAFSGGIGIVDAPSDAVVNVGNVISCIFDGTSRTIWQDGIQGETTLTTGALVAGSLSIGAWVNSAALLQGDLAEILIYNRAVTNAERLQLEAYLASKYYPLDGTPPP